MMNAVMNLMHDQNRCDVAYWIEPILVDVIQCDVFVDLSVVWLVGELAADLDDISPVESLQLMNDLFDQLLLSFGFDFHDVFA
jgi:inosine-uridine nucleoside N-ribohydrolase